MSGLSGDEAPGSGTTRRGGLLVFLFGLALIIGDVALVLLFWHSHTRMFGVIFIPGAVGVLFAFAGLNAMLRPSRRQ